MTKKINKRIMMVIFMILVISLSLGIGAYAAYVLNATEVQYTKSNGTTVSVKAALDELYNKTNKIYHLMGDEFCIGTEHFYLMTTMYEGANNEIWAIAKYPLDGNTFSQNYVKQKTSRGISSTDKIKYNNGVTWPGPYSSSGVTTYSLSGVQSKCQSWSVPVMLNKYQNYLRTQGLDDGYVSLHAETLFPVSYNQCNGNVDVTQRVFIGDNDEYQYWTTMPKVGKDYAECGVTCSDGWDEEYFNYGFDSEDFGGSTPYCIRPCVKCTKSEVSWVD